MVRCVIVNIKNLEETRKSLSSRNLINDEWKIETSDSKGYIPVKDEAELSEYDTCSRSLESRDVDKTVEEILGYKPTYEWLSDIVLLKEDSNIDEIVDAFNRSTHNPKSILRKCSDIKGEKRIREWTTVYGEETETIYRENGYEYKLDITETYFSPRLATERRRVCSKVSQDENVVDMFAGVGPYSVPSADQGANVIACDINELAVDYLRYNAERNNVSDNITALNLDARDLPKQYENYADTVIMNLPHSASQFMDAATKILSNNGKIVYYGFLSRDKNKEDLEQIINSAISEELDKTVTVRNIKRVRPYAPDVDNVRSEVRINNR